MTNEEAIEILSGDRNDISVGAWKIAVMMAIKTLENQNKYEKALNMMACQIVDFSKEKDCEGCPLKGSGIDRWGSSCKQKIVEYYKSEAGMGVSE